MRRRRVLASALAGAAALAAPRVARAASASVLKFIPQSDLATLDPHFTTASVTREHGLLVFDTLYGMDNNWQAQPQMVAGHVVSDGGKLWELTLRDGLTFHDGTMVLARDAVASIKRWGQRDAFGAELLARTDEMTAPTDKLIRLRLNKPFALVPDALAVIISVPVIMPERLAKTDPFRPVTEMVGSGPYRFVASERVPGSRVVYERFAGYQPRSDGKPEFSAGPKVAHFERVEWTVVPDPATAAAALLSGEFDWWENPTIDLVPELRRNKDVAVVVKDRTTQNAIMRFNSLYPPFDNVAIRRLVVSAIDQRDFMQAVGGAAPDLVVQQKVGLFVPGTPMASDVGVSVMQGAKDAESLRAQLAAAGYRGERIVVLAATDTPSANAVAEVAGDLLRRIGFNVDYQALDWGTVQQQRASKEPLDKGGWSIFFTMQTSTQNITPAAAVALRADGKGWYGWPTDPDMERLRAAWFDAPDLAAQQQICRDMQTAFWRNPSYAPLGMVLQPTAFRTSLTDIREGLPQFYGVRRV
ncbi:MAG TPA: ABC transporter substrate-binding protein [Acetobacteraceae bacterium]|nr:ABC transporter substrate-binding protein [Acetobacteraceae bacterium]